ncbi:two-component system, cell cycle response regulator CtrA [Bradyrhizobium brasilense]|uniref:Two-component system, cell cycle response regulator CtrA n=1 Tax=Bradyrhizobium brasilense TaxID=1419277 RepID=A0A1G6INM0_9BRAD|nr:winged helix-turn-helix domain-containing protein [Bradyrhizobium brasilense]SDC08087.1 two-component system, cell cycle response regulator CtrA [Bradyrhizobium brasilense]
MTLRDDYVSSLEQENDALRARIRDLEEQLGFTFECPPQFGLTAHEAKIFGLLMKKPLVTKEFAISALYFHKQDEAEIKIVDVFICKARKKLKPFNIEIETVWGQGYRLTAASRAIAEQLLAEANGMLRNLEGAA